MPLIDLKTDLKSLRFGKDRIGGGDSGQPYIKSDIPEGISSLGAANKDFLLRGGISAISDSATDVLRLGKMFTDLKSPSGILFTAKQNLLSRTAVRTQTSGILNEGTYTPLSTLAQAGVNFSGYHLNKQGLNPFELTGAYSNNDNLYAVRMRNYTIEAIESPDGILKNRLFALYESKIQNNSIGNFNAVNSISTLPTEILSYQGGPGSILGIGNTNIQFADQRTGKNNLLYTRNKTDWEGKTHNLKPNTIELYKDQVLLFGASTEYNKYMPLESNKVKIDVLTQFNNPNFSFSVYNTGSTFPDTNTTIASNNNTSVLSQLELYETGSQLKEFGKYSGKIVDFRASLRQNVSASSVISNAPSYNPGDNKTIEGRVYAGDPGKKGNILSYTAGKNNGADGALDKINALPIYRSSAVDTSKEVNDLVKFRIAIIDNDNPTFKTFLHFRAFLDSISDNYSATWTPIGYLGRGEDFYNYDKFSRTVSLGWTVAAQSKEELIPMYKKLNYLASTLAPDYSPNGFMRGNLVQLTIGGYLYEQPGIITGLNYTLEEGLPWEIGINDEGNYDPTVKELAHIVKVTGFNFTPIHNFVPGKQSLTFDENGNLTRYGNQRFIALEAGSNNNYDN